ncbi:MAG TPA: hypothetical protein VF774_19155 [Pseudoduganella sp.]|jgi:hypothetical protein
MNEERMHDEFEALPFPAGDMAAEGGFANGLAGEFANEFANGFSNELASEWLGEDEGESEEERGRMPMGGRVGGGMARGGPRPVHRAGARPGRGPVARPSRPQGNPSPGSRPGPRPGRWPPGPYWGPFYGWPRGVMVSEPMGYPPPRQDGPEPAGTPEPIEPVDFPAQDDGGEEGGTSEEIPPEFSAVVGKLGLPGKPDYTLLGSLMRAPALLKPRTAGFYLIVFPAGPKSPGKFRAYSGETDDLRRRLLEHVLEATRLGLVLPRHKVYIAKSSLDDKARRAIEYAIHDRMLKDHFGVLTNPRRELEAMAWQ